MRHLWSVLLCSVAAPALANQPSCADCGAPPAIAVESIYTGEIWRNAAGGTASGNRYLDNLDITVDADGEQLFGIEGLQLFGYLLYNNGHSVGELTNAAQGVSNIESTRAVRLYELWTQWQPGSGDSSVRFGLYDLNSEFDSMETAALFINPSHGIGPDFSQSGENGPSIFPTTSLAVRALKTSGPWTFQAAALDGVPGDADRPDRSGIHLSSEEGALLVGEINYRTSSDARVGAGYWQYTAEFASFATDAAGEPRQERGNAGFYLLAESAAYFSADPDRGLRFFARTGAAEDEINPVRRYYGAGAVVTGWSARRAADQIGFAVAIAELGTPFRESQQFAGMNTTRREYNYELTYRSNVTQWLTLQADVQYVIDPGMDPALESAWVVGLRFEVGHSWDW